MKIQVWSDVMCPFCYIGKKNMEAAVAKLPFKDEIEIEWKSYQLDPTLDKNTAGISINTYLSQKKGLPVDKIKEMQQNIVEIGNKAGIQFNQENAVVVNTNTAHRLIHFAQENGKGSEMEEALFKAHFTDEKNVADVTELANLAASVGLDKVKAEEVLHSEAYDYEVNQDIMDAKNMGISGVPFFVLNNKYAVSGAQPSEVFEEALFQTYNETQAISNSRDSGSCCSVDGGCH
ncbi:DsbA family oxidoreductase [Myroides ceti]|uniref:DsbA family oxidoreductase n=1 Tax=Paenimyroides ceti TaxID=395087 RepID=A0ABT8CNL2_9FLAO|nr:DsbA family oxidoreductase [Paenimyroides ceti]MDN3706112.1 DsbA family oxidoreductase [Paenimyroides ceti]